MSASQQKMDGGSYSELLQRLQYHNNNTPLGVIEFDADLRVVAWNDEARRIFGWQASEVVGRLMWDIPWIHPEDRDKIATVADAMATGGAPKTVSPNRNLRKDGSVVWCEWYNSSLTGPDGKTRSIQSLVLDVTSRHEAEAQLLRAKELSEAVNRVSQLLHTTLDPDEVIRRIMVEGVAALGCDSAAVSQRDDDGWTFRYVHGMPPDLVGKHFDNEQKRHAVCAMEIRDVISIADAFNDSRFNREHFRRQSVRSVLVAPLILRGEPYGVVFFYYLRGTHAFTDAEESFTRQIGSSAATALEHAQLFEEQKKIEGELRSSEANLRAILEASKESIWLIGRDGQIQLGNGTGFNRVDRASADVIGKNMRDILPPEILPLRLAMLAKVVESGEPTEFEDQRNGVFFQNSLYPVFDCQGRVTSVAWFARDVTGRKRAAEALKESEERFRALADSIPNLAWWADAEGNRKWFNQRWYDYTGTTFEQVQGMGWQSVHDPQMLPRVIERWQASLTKGEPFEMEFPLRGKDGKFRWFLTRILPVRDAAGKVARWFGTNTGVTDIRDARMVLAKHKEELEALVAERTAKLQELVGELEHFSYSITHDMRAPLRAMRGFAELLSRDAGVICTPEEEKMLLERIITAAERMDALITDSLNYSKAIRQELPLAPVDVGKLLRGMLDSYPEFQTANASITIENPLPRVLGNEAGLTQCFSNLLANAVKFAKPGQKPRIHIRAEQRENDWTRIWVEDEGIGISPDLLPRVFEMFSRGASHQTGTGIGLALVRKVVHRMSGRVGVESRPGQGSRFWIELKTFDPPSNTPP